MKLKVIMIATIFTLMCIHTSLNAIVFYINNATEVCPTLLIKFDNYQSVMATGDTVTIKPPENALKFSVSSNCQGQLVVSEEALIQEDKTYVIGKKNIYPNPAIPSEQYELTIE